MIHVTAGAARIPALGLGTFRMSDDEAERMVGAALELGYRHLDTAQGYRNERGVGRGLKASGLPRAEVFVTTKISPGEFRPENLLRAADERLELLDTPYVDLLLLHWPNLEVPLSETLDALAQVQAKGQTRHAGVSNFPSKLLLEALEQSPVPLVTNQVEYHPYLNQHRLLSVMAERGMALTAYSPVAKGEVMRDATLQDIGRAHGKSAAQVALRWLVQQDVVAIPKTASEARAQENLAIFDLELSDAEMERIFGLARSDGRMVDPDGAPDWDDDWDDD